MGYQWRNVVSELFSALADPPHTLRHQNRCSRAQWWDCWSRIHGNHSCRKWVFILTFCPPKFWNILLYWCPGYITDVLNVTGQFEVIIMSSASKFFHLWFYIVYFIKDNIYPSESFSLQKGTPTDEITLESNYSLLLQLRILCYISALMISLTLGIDPLLMFWEEEN